MVGDTEYLLKLSGLNDTVLTILLTKMKELGEFLVDYTQSEKLSGQVLNVVTGKLRDSIMSYVEQYGAQIELTLGSGGVAYAAIQERGGQTPPRVITANKARVLHFFWQGREIFTYQVKNWPGAKIPPHYYLRDTLSENREFISTVVADAINEATGKRS